MRKLLLLVICLSVASAAIAQRSREKGTNTVVNHPLIVVLASKHTFVSVNDSTDVSSLNPEMIKAVSVLRSKEAIARYGTTAKVGAIEIQYSDRDYPKGYRLMMALVTQGKFKEIENK